VVRLDVLGEEHDPERRVCFAQAARGAGSVVCVVGRHAHVDDREVGKLGVDCLDECRRVGRLGDNLVPSVFEQPGEPFAQECRVLADYDAHDRVVHCVAGGVDGRGYLLSCLPLARRAARVLVRTLRNFAARYRPRAGRSLLAFRGL
jgi:hypothetical protein